MYFRLYKALEIARFAAIGKMYGCITTESCRSNSGVVSGYLCIFY